MRNGTSGTIDNLADNEKVNSGIVVHQEDNDNSKSERYSNPR